MKKLIKLVAGIFLVAVLTSADISPQQKYIDRFAELAVQEMFRSGVPASITLAQGMLESRNGLSALAAEGHNHFGIKCHNDWKGKSMKVDDDAKGECFRVYDHDLDSFMDHSDFLRYRDRYKFLFDYKTTDYKSWAYGLKKAGYATDPQYAGKLIKIIEDYDLGKYDSAKPSDFTGKGKYAGSVTSEDKNDEIKQEALFPAQKKKEKEAKRAGSDKKETAKAEKTKRSSSASEKRKGSQKKAIEPVPETIPESPNSLEESKPVTRNVQEELHFSVSKKVWSRNGVTFVYAREGDTYKSLAEENNLFHKEILKFNDLTFDTRLLPGTEVFLQAKKNQCAKGLDKYIVAQDGEILRDICQRFGVKQKSIMKINGFDAAHTLREGDTILLRK